MAGRKGRVSGVFLGGFGLALGLLMVYSLVFEGAGGCGAGSDPAGLVEVPVLFLERGEWRIFARAVQVCVEPGRALGRLLDEGEDSLLVETNRFRRPVRFTWRAVRGEGQTRLEMHRELTSETPPVAVVGSSNTVLTLALAEQLRLDTEGKPTGGPLLLVPWATSVSLLDVYRGRTFRFCSNNRRQAKILIDCLKAQANAQGPRRAVLVVDRLDPYSVDLADCFRSAITRAFPKAEVVEPPAESSNHSGAIEQARARAIWRDVTDGPGGETWVVLPLQNEPARRMMTTLNGAAPGRHDAGARPFSVLCGDSIGLTTLRGFANQLVFPVWCASTGDDLSGPNALEEDVQHQAEIVAAILIGLDRDGRPPTADELRSTLVRTGSDESEPPSPFGLPLAFRPDGEREGFNPGAVLNLRPDSPRVFLHAAGRWTEPRPIKTGGSP